MKPYFVNRDFNKISLLYREFAYTFFDPFMNTLYIFGIIIKNSMHKKYKLSDNLQPAFYPKKVNGFSPKYHNACSANRAIIKTSVIPPFGKGKS